MVGAVGGTFVHSCPEKIWSGAYCFIDLTYPCRCVGQSWTLEFN